MNINLINYTSKMLSLPKKNIKAAKLDLRVYPSVCLKKSRTGV